MSLTLRPHGVLLVGALRRGAVLQVSPQGGGIRGDVGQAVLAIADAKVSSPLGSWGHGQLGEGIALDRLSYSHVRVGRLVRNTVVDRTRFLLLKQRLPQRPGQRMLLPRADWQRAG